MRMHRIAKIAIFILLFSLIAGALFGQTKVQRYVLNINSNVRGAKVFINAVEKGTTPLRIQLNRGDYNIVIRSEGYRDFSQSLSLTRNASINATLQPMNFTLNVNSNVGGAGVFINDAAKGNAPLRVQLPPGDYRIRMSAPGYHDFNQRVQLNRNMTINGELRPATILSVDSNVVGATVYVNNVEKGTAPLEIELEPGRYTVRLSAPGYQEYSQVVSVERTVNLSAELKPATSTLRFSVPNSVLNTNAKNPRGRITLIIDGRKTPPGQWERMILHAGRHRIRVETDTLAYESDFEIAAGREYTIELGLSLLLR